MWPEARGWKLGLVCFSQVWPSVTEYGHPEHWWKDRFFSWDEGFRVVLLTPGEGGRERTPLKDGETQ